MNFKSLITSIKAQLSPSMLYLSLFVLSLTPFFYLAFNLSERIQKLNLLEEKINAVEENSRSVKEREKREKNLAAQIQNADQFYIDKYLETLLFLEPEVKRLEAVCQAVSCDPAAKKRLQFLKEGDNKLLFAEQQIQRAETFREVEERQQNPVEVNAEDLKKLLSRIESVTIGNEAPRPNSPQLIIKSFELSKKASQRQEDLFLVNMFLLKREGLPHE